MYRKFIIYGCAFIFILTSSVSWATTSHFIVDADYCSPPIMKIRGRATMNGQPLSLQDEIGLFYNNTLCGASKIADPNGNYYIDVYPAPCVTDGPPTTGEAPLQVKLWDSGESQEIDSDITLTIEEPEIENAQGQLIFKKATYWWHVDIEYTQDFTLNDVSPKQGYLDEDIPITLSGQNFNNSAVGIIENDTLSVALTNVVFVNSTTIQATIPAGQLTAGDYDIVLTMGLMSKVLADIFQIKAPPQIDRMWDIATDNSYATNENNVMVFIEGSNFISGAAVYLGSTSLPGFNTPAPNVMTSTLITAKIPAGFEPGLYDVTVTNPPPASRTGSLMDAFEVTGSGKTLNFKDGLNMFAYPIDVPAGNSTAYTFLQNYQEHFAASLVSFQSFDNQTQTWKISYFNESSETDGDNFEVKNGTGYLLYLNQEVHDVSFSGTLSSFLVDLYPGLNLISANKEEGYDSHHLLQDLADKVAAIHKWDKESGRFKATFWLNDLPAGDNFPLKKDESYLIYMREEILNCNLL